MWGTMSKTVRQTVFMNGKRLDPRGRHLPEGCRYLEVHSTMRTASAMGRWLCRGPELCSVVEAGPVRAAVVADNMHSPTNAPSRPCCRQWL